MSILGKLNSEEHTFKVQRLASAYAISKKAITIASERFISKVVDTNDALMVKLLVDIATQEEELHEYPEDWWQAIKERWFPKWLLRRYPVKYAQVWAYHKFPELEVPNLGKELINLKVFRYDELEKLKERRND